MNKMLLFLALLFCGVNCYAQNTIQVINSTSCTVTYIIYADIPGNCIGQYSSILYTIPPSSSTTWSTTSISWTGASAPPNANWTLAAAYEQYGTCTSNDTKVGQPCSGFPTSGNYTPTCSNCTSIVNVTWVGVSNPNKKLVFN